MAVKSYDPMGKMDFKSNSTDSDYLFFGARGISFKGSVAGTITVVICTLSLYLPIRCRC